MPNPRKPTALPDKSYRQPFPTNSRDPSSFDQQPQQGGSPPSNNLWIGNITNDTTEADIKNLFARFGPIDSVTPYSLKNYAFMCFRRVDDARAARDALQGVFLRGNPIRIEFARPAKPGKRLWVGGISSSVTKEQLEDEFLKFGEIEDFKFMKDRNSALIDYHRLEDAAGAMKNMNGKCLGGEQLRVDFLRSQTRRENYSDFHDARDGHFNNRRSMGPPEPYWMSADARKFPESSQVGHKRLPPSQHSGGRREGYPSKVLWIGYPPSVQIDEQMLHNAMILFGEIERIKCFPSKNFSFVEFRSVDEAKCAKDGLQGRLFNDPRIQIRFSSSELAPPKDSAGLFTGFKGPIPDMFLPEPPFGPGQMDFFGYNRPPVPNNFPGLPLAPNGMNGHPLAPNGMNGPNVVLRPFGPQGGLNPHVPGSEMHNEVTGFYQNFTETNANSPMGQNWSRPSLPSPGLLPSPAQGVRPPTNGTWEESDAKPSKRSRIDRLPHEDTSCPPYGFERHGIVASELLTQGQRTHPPVGLRVASGGPLHQGLPDIDYCWRGTIAKGGSPVCLARCVPIGKGIDSQLPEIVNCSARTGLDMLAKHYAEASGFDIVFFLPDSEDDFASYTEFLRYLGEKNRAGVAKFDDGTTLFLVPPSDFLSNVLNVSGPDRLYGIVLKSLQQMPNTAVQLQRQIPLPQYIDGKQLTPPQTDFSSLHQKDCVLQMDNNRMLHEDGNPHSSTSFSQIAEGSQPMRAVPHEYASNHSSMPQDGVSLPPELFATLAALLPASTLPPASIIAQPPLTSFPPSYPPDNVVSSQGQRQNHQTNLTSTQHHYREEHAVNLSPHGHLFNTQSPLFSQSPAYTQAVNGPDNSTQAMLHSSGISEPSQHVYQQGVASSRPSNNFTTPQGGQFAVPQPPNQQFQVNSSLNPEKSYGSVNTTDDGLFHSSAVQQPKTPVTPPTQVQGLTLSQTHSDLSSSLDDKVNMGFSHQLSQSQPAPLGAGQSADEDGEADRKQRYQSTLQFAATLLLQIQQQQQLGSTQGAQGSSSH